MADDKATSERIDGPTPSGGTYSVAYFFKGDRVPCAKSEATGVEILEFDEDDQNIARTWLERPKSEEAKE